MASGVPWVVIANTQRFEWNGVRDGLGALLGGWIGRVLGLYREDETVGFIMAVIGAIIILALYRLVVPRRTRI